MSRDRILYCRRFGHAYTGEPGDRCPVCAKRELLADEEFLGRGRRRNPTRESETVVGLPMRKYAVRIVAKIYDKILKIEAQKGADSPFPKEKFYHDFKDGAIYGLEDGSILIKSPSGRNLWNAFEYDVDERGRAINVEKD